MVPEANHSVFVVWDWCILVGLSGVFMDCRKQIFSNIFDYDFFFNINLE